MLSPPDNRERGSPPLHHGLMFWALPQTPSLRVLVGALPQTPPLRRPETTQCLDTMGKTLHQGSALKPITA